MSTKAKKTSVKTTAAYNDRHRAAGLQHAKIWIHPDDVPRVRKYAAKQAATREALAEAKVRRD